MIKKLKILASSSRTDTETDEVIKILYPGLRYHLVRLNSFSASELLSDAIFTAKIIKPAHAALYTPSNRKLKRFQDFERRFSIAMLHARDELCLIDTETDQVHLAFNAMDRLPQILNEGFKLSAANNNRA